MGIVNVTPDSFSDGGRFIAPEDAVDHALQLVADGADLLDIGGESTRPGAPAVAPSVELARIRPVVQSLLERTDVPLSIDTTKVSVAEAALELGAHIINDISGGTFEPGILRVVAREAAGYIGMHTPGTPATMMANATWDDVVAEVEERLQAISRACVEAGIEPDATVLDPGLGFGKLAADNVRLLMRVAELTERLQRPVLIGISRKRTVRDVCGSAPQRVAAGTTAFETLAMMAGAAIIRTHDVNAAVAARNAVAACRSTM